MTTQRDKFGNWDDSESLERTNDEKTSSAMDFFEDEDERLDAESFLQDYCVMVEDERKKIEPKAAIHDNLQEAFRKKHISKISTPSNRNAWRKKSGIALALAAGICMLLVSTFLLKNDPAALNAKPKTAFNLPERPTVEPMERVKTTQITKIKKQGFPDRQKMQMDEIAAMLLMLKDSTTPCYACQTKDMETFNQYTRTNQADDE